MMPGLNGFRRERSVRQEPGTAAPIILVTALRTPRPAEGNRAGCDDFISKPVDRWSCWSVKSLLKVKAYQDLVNNYRSSSSPMSPSDIRADAGVRDLKRFPRR